MLPSTIVVTDLNDDGSANSLRAAVQQADQSGGALTIELLSGKIYHLNNGSKNDGELAVQSVGPSAVNLTITTTASGMATIDANFTSRLFEVFGDREDDGAALTLVNVDLNRGKETGDDGGGVLVDFGGTFTLQQSQITNCVDQANQDRGGRGGAIFNNGTATLQNSTILANQALGCTSTSPNGIGCTSASPSGIGCTSASPSGKDGAAFAGGVFNQGTLTILNSTFFGNIARGGSVQANAGDDDSLQGGAAYGGALYDDGTGLTITGTTFAKNQAIGGNAALISHDGTATGGAGQGGAVYLSGDDAILVNDTLAFNTASGGTASGEEPDDDDHKDELHHDAKEDEAHAPAGVGGSAAGGAIFFAAAATGGELGFVTVAYNRAAGGAGTSANGSGNGGGIASASESPSLMMENDLVAKNTATSASPDVTGSFASLGHNLVGNVSGGNGFSTVSGDILGGGHVTPVNPGLDTQLRNNGGPTQTLALLPGSIAIDHGDNSFEGPDSHVDQRGISRPQPSAGTVDIGAYEVLRVAFSESYRVHWNPTVRDNNSISGNLLTPLLAAGVIPASQGTMTVSVPHPPAGFTFQPDGRFTYKPPLGFFSVVSPLHFQFDVNVNGLDLGLGFNVFIKVYRGLRLGQQT